MHQPGIEPGSVPWQGTILPLDHWCVDARLFEFNIRKLTWVFDSSLYQLNYKMDQISKKKKNLL